MLTLPLSDAYDECLKAIYDHRAKIDRSILTAVCSAINGNPVLQKRLQQAVRYMPTLVEFGAVVQEHMTALVEQSGDTQFLREINKILLDYNTLAAAELPAEMLKPFGDALLLGARTLWTKLQIENDSPDAGNMFRDAEKFYATLATTFSFDDSIVEIREAIGEHLRIGDTVNRERSLSAALMQINEIKDDEPALIAALGALGIVVKEVKGLEISDDVKKMMVSVRSVVMSVLERHIPEISSGKAKDYNERAVDTALTAWEDMESIGGVTDSTKMLRYAFTVFDIAKGIAKAKNKEGPELDTAVHDLGVLSHKAESAVPPDALQEREDFVDFMEIGMAQVAEAKELHTDRMNDRIESAKTSLTSAMKDVEDASAGYMKQKWHHDTRSNTGWDKLKTKFKETAGKLDRKDFCTKVTALKVANDKYIETKKLVGEVDADTMQTEPMFFFWFLRL